MSVCWGTVPEWLQAICAGLGLWGLYRYTQYTKDIRNATLVSQQAAVEPLLLCSFVDSRDGRSTFEVLNAGNGMALKVTTATILEALGLSDFFEISKASTTSLGDLRPGHSAQFASPQAEKAIGETIIIQATDVNGDTHQLNLAVSSRVFGPAMVSQARVSDRQSKPISTFHKRVIVKDQNDRNTQDVLHHL